MPLLFAKMSHEAHPEIELQTEENGRLPSFVHFLKAQSQDVDPIQHLRGGRANVEANPR